MHVFLVTTKYAAGLPAQQVSTAECLCGFVAVCAAEDADDLDRTIADHLAFHGAA